MTYGTIKVDTVTFTNAGVDKSVTLSGLVQNPTFSGNVTVTGTLSGVTVTGTTANFTSGNFTNISGGTHTITSGVFAAGSAASPSITFTGDLNTGIYSPGADQVAISTGGSGRLFVDASGNVGVATGTPSYRLEVNGTISQSSQGTSSALIQAVNAGGIFYHGLDNSAGTTFGHAYAAALWHSGAYPILFATNGSERLRITSAGLVGVGTSSPSNAFQIESDANSDQGVWVRNSNTGSSASSNVYVNSAAGQLLFRAHSAAHSVWPATALISSSSGLTGGLAFNTGAAAPLAFLINNSERLRITSTGQLSHIGAGSSGSPAVNFSGSAPSNSLVIDSSGNVGINTAAGGASGFGTFFKIKTTSSSPGFFLENGAADSWWGVYGGTSAADSAAIVYPSTGSIRIATSTSVGVGGFSEKIRITSAGLVGIGTSTPQASLDIASGTFQAVRTNLSSVTDTFHQYRGTPDGVGYEHARVFSGRDTSVHTYGSYLAFYTEGKASGTTDTSLERLRIDSSGRVGIGTTSPAQLLHLNSPLANATQWIAAGTGYTSNLSLLANGSGGGLLLSSATDSSASITNSLNAALIFGTNNTERARIDSSGRLGIGTSTPSFTAHVSGAKNTTQLFVAAPTISAVNDFTQIGFGLSNTEFGLIRLGFDNPSAITNSYFSFFNNNGSGLQESLRIDSSGRVGIGTSSPTAPLQVVTTSAAYTTSMLAIGEQSNATGKQLYFGMHTTDGKGYIQSVHWGTSYKELLLNPNGGNVGIGTSSPGDPLHIAVSGANSANIRLQSGDGRTYNVGSTGSGYGSSGKFIIYDITAGAERFCINSSGSVGIGTTSPSYLLDVASSVAQVGNSTDAFIQYKSTAGNWHVGANSSNAYVFYAGTYGSGTERARIDSSGRLLVGTSTTGGISNARLQVAQTSNYCGEFTQYSNDAYGSYFFISKSRGAAGNQGLVQSGDEIGVIGFSASDGTAYRTAALIQAAVDGTPGTNDMPGRLVFSTTADGASSPTERMRIQQSGAITFGSSTNTSPALNGAAGIVIDTTPNYVGLCRDGDTALGVGRLTNDGSCVRFYRSGTDVGNISVTTTATTYNSGSDYRLKENVTPLAGGIARLKQLKPSQFNFIVEPHIVVDGFIAHEVQEIVPQAVTGEKDDMDDDGNPIYQGIDQSKLVPLLTAALQEAVAKIESLEARLTAAGI